MAVLCDWEIRAYYQSMGMILPFKEELLNPASLDVLLGDTLLIEQPGRTELAEYSIAKTTKDSPFWITPGAFVLAQTQETFNLPDNIAAQFVLKSSRAREGYNNMLAGWADPGFHGSVLTLELQNCRKHADLPLYKGMKIGQIVFFTMSNKPEKDYSQTGRYNNDFLTTQSKG